MRVKLNAGCGTAVNLMAGYGTKLLRCERDLLILIGMMGISFKLTTGFGMQDEKQKIIGNRSRRYAENCNLSVRLGHEL